MERVILCKDFDIAPVAVGTMNLMEWGLDRQELLRRVKEYVELGLTTFDHADIYGQGECERYFGEVLKQEPALRGKMEIITKGGIVYDSLRRPYFVSESYNLSKEYIITACEQSLMRLGIDTIDLYLLHRPCPLMGPAETAEALEKLYRDGKVRHVGVSNFLPEQIKALESCLTLPILTNEIKMSVQCMDFLADGTMEDALQRKIPLLAYSPLCGGELHRKNLSKTNLATLEVLEEIRQELGAESIDEVMYAWLYRLPVKVVPITGTGKKERVLAAVKALEYSMSREQWYDILRIARSPEVSRKYHGL